MNKKYMERCLYLASLAQGNVSPNPMVGAVIVHNGKIIGEGFHKKHGEAHAEVNAINSVINKELLKDSTLYVSLEPCCHWGKTPPCTKIIIDSGIKKVVIACFDPFAKVNGEGVKTLKDNGIEVECGVMEKEAEQLNKAFYTYHTKKRPYIFFKWAQSIDGFIDILREPHENPYKITGKTLQVFTHKKRAHSDAIMLGTNTVIMDNPSLNVRKWKGNNPMKVIIDRQGKINLSSNVFKEGSVLLFSEKNIKGLNSNTELIETPFNNIENIILQELYKRNIQSLMIEGGTKLIESFIAKNIWDEAFCLISNIYLGKGIKAPQMNKQAVETQSIESCKTNILRFTNT